MPRILIIDDEKDMTALLRRVISEETPHELVTETDPVAAMKFVNQPVDLVITDLKMPRMDGMRVMEIVKEIRPDVPVIIMTAYATIDTAVEAIRKGAYDYITKPFQRERILVTIEKALKWCDILNENKALRQALDASAGFPAPGSSCPRCRLRCETRRYP